jgi:hypothetical protein
MVIVCLHIPHLLEAMAGLKNNLEGPVLADNSHMPTSAYDPLLPVINARSGQSSTVLTTAIGVIIDLSRMAADSLD